MTSRASFVSALLCALFAAVLAGSAALPSAHAAIRRTTCWSGYSYDGVQSPTPAFGVGGTLSASRPSAVDIGHVAAWVGVGGAGMGPGGSDEWVQAGIAGEAGQSEVLYYEYKRPGDLKATYKVVGLADPGVGYTFDVYERATQQNIWRVALNGIPVSDSISLPSSHGAFEPVATAENWDGGVSGSCNSYSFVFTNLAVRAQFGGSWQPFDLSRVLHDPAYQITLRASGFTASSR